MVTWDPKTRPKKFRLCCAQVIQGQIIPTPHSNQESTKPAMKACFFLVGGAFWLGVFPVLGVLEIPHLSLCIWFFDFFKGFPSRRGGPG